MIHTRSDRLERWLGSEVVANLSRAQRDFPVPIPIAGVPGEVYAMPGGDFIGEILVGQEMSAYDRLADMVVQERKRRIANIAHHRRLLLPRGRGGPTKVYAFATVDAIEAAATAGKYQDLLFNKTGVAGLIGVALDLWGAAGYPAAGAAGGASPGGTNWSSASAGALPFSNPATADSLQPMSGWATASVLNNCLLLYDRLHSVVKTMASVAAQAVTGTPTRYQNTTPGNVQYAGGNFYFPSNPTTILAATAHNWNVCQYTNQAGTATRSSPSMVGISACPVRDVDLAANTSWFMPFQAGDLGVQKVTQLQCSASVATGTIDFVVGHALCYYPCPVALLVCPQDWLFTGFRAVKILDSACLAFMEMPKPATGATVYQGSVYAVAE